MRQSKVLILLTMISLYIYSCKKSYDKVDVNTLHVNNITSHSAEVWGKIFDLGSGISDHGFCWSKSQNPHIGNDTNNLGRATNTGEYKSIITKLDSGTTYYVKAYATSHKETVYGEQFSFTTIQGAILTTQVVSSITSTSAISGGNITSDGGSPIIDRGVCWSESPDPTLSDANTWDGLGPGNFMSNISELQPGTTYHVRAYATNSSGTAYGNDIMFTTHSVPKVTTVKPFADSSMSQFSGGDVTNDGGSPVSARGVCWSTSQNPTLEVSTKTIDGTGLGSFISSLTGLIQGTVYYLRAYATNNEGSAYGEQISIATDIDGNIYTLVQIGTQIWMVENLKTTKCNNGTPIQLLTDSTDWRTLTTAGYCWYNNDEATYKNTYGALYYMGPNNYPHYSYYPDNLCPVGWKVPSVDDILQLLEPYGGRLEAAGALKESGNAHWISPNTGATNVSGFTALPGGRSYGRSLNIGSVGNWWTSTRDTPTRPISKFMMTTDSYEVSIGASSGANSIRCMKK